MDRNESPSSQNIPPPPPGKAPLPEVKNIPPPPSGRAIVPSASETRDVDPATVEVVREQVESVMTVAASIADTHDKIENALARAEKVANVLDKKKFIDPLLGMVLPVIGDKITAVAGMYIVAEAMRAGVPKAKIARMLMNIGLDFAIGAFPIVGDFGDFLFKAHARNVEIFREYVVEKKKK